MKKSFLVIALLSLVGAFLMAGCEKQADTTPTSTPSTNAPSTNAPAK